MHIRNTNSILITLFLCCSPIILAQIQEIKSTNFKTLEYYPLGKSKCKSQREDGSCLSCYLGYFLTYRDSMRPKDDFKVCIRCQCGKEGAYASNNCANFKGCVACNHEPFVKYFKLWDDQYNQERSYTYCKPCDQNCVDKQSCKDFEGCSACKDPFVPRDTSDKLGGNTIFKECQSKDNPNEKILWWLIAIIVFAVLVLCILTVCLFRCILKAFRKTNDESVIDDESLFEDGTDFSATEKTSTSGKNYDINII